MSIPNKSIYNQNFGTLWQQNAPVQYQLPKFLQLYTWLLFALQWVHDMIFSSGYSDGSTAANWISGTAYAYGNRVIDVDYAVYEVKNLAGITSTTNPHLDTVNWFKVLDTFIGARERAYYNGNMLMLQYALNRYFQVGNVALPWSGPATSGAGKQIYIVKSVSDATDFWLSNFGVNALTSYLVKNTKFATNYLSNLTLSITKYSFTVFVPSAVATAITANQPSGITYKDVVGAIVTKYAQSNLLYNITTY